MAQLRITRVLIVEDVVDTQYYYPHDSGTEYTTEEVIKLEQDKKGQEFFEAVSMSVEGEEPKLTLCQVEVIDE